MSLPVTLLRRFVMGLLLAAMTVGGVEAQGTVVSLSAGPQLSDDDVDRFGSTRGRLELAIQRPFLGPLLLRGGVAGSVVGPPPCPAPPGSQTRWTIEPGRSLEGHLDLGVSLPMGGGLTLEPFAGTGARYLTAAETDDPSPDAYGLSSSTRVLVSGGGTGYARLTGQLGAFARLRVTRHYMGTQTLTPRDGEPFEAELRDLDTVSLTAGLTVRF